jgi:hypothetical protein
MLRVEKGHNGVPEAETIMRGARFNLEDAPRRRRDTTRVRPPEPAEPERYPLTKQGSLAIRAARASGDGAQRDVA